MTFWYKAIRNAMPAKSTPKVIRQASLRKWLGWWLITLAAMIVVMAWLGAVTRLTESGLSIVDWRPVTGTIPPLSETDWQHEFQKYQSSPQYQQVNKGMTLADFKKIFLWEYVHRLWGRLMGVVLLVPFIFALIKRHITKRFALRVMGLFALGGAQGFIGWWMVKSGLIHRPEVSAYRLSAHLVTAALLYTYALWLGLSVLWPRAENKGPRSLIDGGLVFYVLVVILSGAAMAGTDAALAYPLLTGGQFLPADMREGAYQLYPWWRNLFESIDTIQLHHRLLTVGLFIFVVARFFAVRHQHMIPRRRRLVRMLVVVIILQLSLGMSVILETAHLGHIPVMTASLHQVLAFLILGLLVANSYESVKHH